MFVLPTNIFLSLWGSKTYTKLIIGRIQYVLRLT